MTVVPDETPNQPDIPDDDTGAKLLRPSALTYPAG